MKLPLLLHWNHARMNWLLCVWPRRWWIDNGMISKPLWSFHVALIALQMWVTVDVHVYDLLSHNDQSLVSLEDTMPMQMEIVPTTMTTTRYLLPPPVFLRDEVLYGVVPDDLVHLPQPWPPSLLPLPLPPRAQLDLALTSGWVCRRCCQIFVLVEVKRYWIYLNPPCLHLRPINVSSQRWCRKRLYLFVERFTGVDWRRLYCLENYHRHLQVWTSLLPSWAKHCKRGRVRGSISYLLPCRWKISRNVVKAVITMGQWKQEGWLLWGFKINNTCTYLQIFWLCDLMLCVCVLLFVFVSV